MSENKSRKRFVDFDFSLLTLHFSLFVKVGSLLFCDFVI